MEKKYTEEQLKILKEKQLEFSRDCRTPKVKDTSQEEIEKGNHVVYPFTLITGEVVNNKKEFLYSKHWGKIKFFYIRFLDNQFKMRKNSSKMKCELCCEDYQHTEIQLHHLTYKNFGNEKYNELIRVCFKCHCKIHKRAEKTKLEYNGEKKFNRKNLFNLSDLITFGKYKGKRVKEVVKIDKQYIKWLQENNVAKFNDKVLELL